MWLSGQWASCCGHLFPSFHRHFLLRLSFSSCSAGSGGTPPAAAERIHFMVDYLRCSCGFTENKARTASKHYAHLKSPENERPDAVLRLLRQVGLGDTDIKRFVKNRPLLLLADAKRTLEPKIRAVQAAGFSVPEAAQVIAMNPNILFFRDLATRIEFWRKFLGTNQYVLKTIKKDPRLLCYIRSLGIPDRKMGSLVWERPWLVFAKPDSLFGLLDFGINVRARMPFSLGFLFVRPPYSRNSTPVSRGREQQQQKDDDDHHHYICWPGTPPIPLLFPIPCLLLLCPWIETSPSSVFTDLVLAEGEQSLIARGGEPVGVYVPSPNGEEGCWNELPASYAFNIDLHGFQKEDIKVQMEGRALQIGVKEIVEAIPTGIRVQDRCVEFWGKIRLLENAREETVKGTFNKGVLTVTCDKETDVISMEIISNE
ncbi:hypothetical protein Taro_021516 [Colocasia esculenta]|uniref:SHSP domain-containing protein n=1 Tax=Colocasia esculenta TaxID=4460 RepID=A0A843V2N3_COLES|nr:hypothetical protein [Colocasia esculenta]